MTAYAFYDDIVVLVVESSGGDQLQDDEDVPDCD
jgi:hypothetical protein